MKKIISKKSSLMETSRLSADLKRLVLEHHPDVGELEIAYFHVREALALKDNRVKVTCDLTLKSGHYRTVTRVVPFTLPDEETRTVHRSWTIVIKSNWYGFGYQLYDENGAAAGESAKGWEERAFAEANAVREVNRLLNKREGRAFQSAKAPRGRKAPTAAPKTRVLLAPIPQQAPPATVARPVVETAAGEAKKTGDASLLPAILAGHYTPSVAVKVNRFCLSVADIFEAWVNRCASPHTRRAYRADVMSFIEFMKITWPEAATDILKVTIADVLDFRGYMLDLGMAPKTVLRRISSLSSFYKYLSAAAAELRLPITVPNPAHAQFVPRGSADARDETKALTATRARQLMGMPTGDDLVDYRDRAILKVYLYTGIRLTTGCRLKMADFHQDGGEATLKLHEKGDKRRVIGMHFNAAQAIGEYIEKAGITSGPLFRAQAASRSREKLSNRPMDSATMYRLIQGYLRRLPGAMKKKQIEDGSEVEYCIYTPHSLRATTATLLLDAGVDIKKVQDLLGHRHITTTQIYDKRRIAASQSASHDVPI